MYGTPITPEMMELIKQGGLTVLVVFLIIALVVEHRRANRERNLNGTLTEQLITTTVKLEATISTLTRILPAGNGKPGA